jgi:hypothetical protein
MNLTMFRIVCDRCGKVTTTPVILDNSALLTRTDDGSDQWLRLCPHCKALWLTILSDFLAGVG